jgi:hypothetical protein
MLKGIHLTLMVGPVVPVPVSRAVLEALTSVEVTVTAGQRSPSGFQLTFRLDNNSPLQTLFLLTGGSLPPIMRVIIVATVNGTPEVLIDGVITNHQLSPGTDGGKSTLVVKGLDLTAVMDWIDFSGFPFPALPAEARVALIIAKYAVFGIIPMVIPSILIDVPIPVERIPRQQGKDLEYINHLADEVGYVFYIKPGPSPGVNLAYWGPEIKVGVPQPALNINMDAHTNIESLNFTFDNDTKVVPVLMIQNLASKAPIPIPVPDITPLSPPLGMIPPLSLNFELIEGTAKLNPLQAAVIGLTKAARTSEAVKATGTLDVRRYGRILKARQLVGVRGAGTAFDGLYYVTSVTHKINPGGEYKQSFSLSRNGLVSTLQKVPV